MVAVVLGVSAPAWAGSHLWRVNELFSNADGTVQFIELHNPTDAANEVILSGKWVKSVVNETFLLFPANLPAGSTAQKYLLLGTKAFAALPGAPTPDYIMDPNFFALDADEIQYWQYAGAEMEFASGELPLDGLNSLDRSGATLPNSPTNFAGDVGAVDASGVVPTVSEWGLLIMAGLLVTVGALIVARRRLIAA